ncbi:MAG: hypothetical protein K940chlam2_00963 [Chlamydiae bacterium]|nr:hypothetical protein [Chlamydiota bacterium]
MADVLDTEQACEYLKIAKPTLYKHVRIGAIPAFKMGRVWRFHKASLEKWIEGKVEGETKGRTARQKKK